MRREGDGGKGRRREATFVKVVGRDSYEGISVVTIVFALPFNIIIFIAWPFSETTGYVYILYMYNVMYTYIHVYIYMYRASAHLCSVHTYNVVLPTGYNVSVTCSPLGRWSANKQASLPLQWTQNSPTNQTAYIHVTPVCVHVSTCLSICEARVPNN